MPVAVAVLMPMRMIVEVVPRLAVRMMLPDPRGVMFVPPVAVVPVMVVVPVAVGVAPVRMMLGPFRMMVPHQLAAGPLAPGLREVYSVDCSL